jgi:hypothetical protein
VVLTVAHLTHEPEDREHVKAMCQGCHLHYDKEHHAETAYRTRKERANTEDMFGVPPNAKVQADGAGIIATVAPGTVGYATHPAGEP